MPGPLATNRTSRAAAPNSPPRKVARRLKARQAEYTGKNAQNGQLQHLPGSQNRKK